MDRLRELAILAPEVGTIHVPASRAADVETEVADPVRAWPTGASTMQIRRESRAWADIWIAQRRVSSPSAATMARDLSPGRPVT